MQPTTPLTDEDATCVNPIIAAAFELHSLRGWHFAGAINHLSDCYRNDRSCPGSRAFTPDEVRAFFAKHGLSVNVVPLPH